MLLSITIREEKNHFYFDQKTQGTKKQFNLTPYFCVCYKIECESFFFWGHFIVTHSNSRKVGPWWPREIKMCSPLSVRVPWEHTSWVGLRFGFCYQFFLLAGPSLWPVASIHKTVSRIRGRVCRQEIEQSIHHCITFCCIFVAIMIYVSNLPWWMSGLIPLLIYC